MKLSAILALLSLLLAVNSATFYYVVTIEHRITRLETLQELRSGLPSRGNETRKTEAWREQR